MLRHIAAIVFVVALVIDSPADARQLAFTALPFLNGHNFSQATAISADGSTIVGLSAGAGFQRAFRWTSNGGMQGLGLWNSASNFATAVSGDGSAIVGWGHPSAQSGSVRAWRWTVQSGQFADLGDIPGEHSSSVSANAISYDGSIVAGASFLNNQPPQTGTVTFRWTESDGMQNLGDLPLGLVESRANDMSDDGSVIVGRGTPEFGHVAYRWTTASGFVSLGDLPVGTP